MQNNGNQCGGPESGVTGKPWETLWKVEIRAEIRNPGPLEKPWETPWEVGIAVEAQNPETLQTQGKCRGKWKPV